MTRSGTASPGSRRFTQAPAETMSRSAVIRAVSVTTTGSIAVEIDPSNRGLLENAGCVAAVAPGQLDHERDGAGGRKHAGVGLEHDVVIVGQRVGCVTLRSSALPDDRQWGIPSSSRLAATRADVIDARRRERDAAGPEEDGLAGVGLQLSPGAEGRGHEPGVRRVCVRVPRDPRGSVRAAAVVTQRKLLDQKNRLAAPGEMICRRRAHRAGTDDHDCCSRAVSYGMSRRTSRLLPIGSVDVGRMPAV